MFLIYTYKGRERHILKKNVIYPDYDTSSCREKCRMCICIQ